MQSSTRVALLVLALGGSAAAQTLDPEWLEGLDWREVGPFRGGRCAAVTGIPQDPDTYYFGACGGGVWKTGDAGRSWHNVSDGFFGGSIGAVAVAASDPNVVYAGGGEKTVRGNVSHGDGVWKSTDAGRTWTHIGLPDSRHVCRLRVDPSNPDLVYAAVLGHLFGPNPERGVFRSEDGGASWERILHVSDDAGAVDLAMDPTNPRILYASLWNVRRTPWSLSSGGEGSGLWKSTDRGRTWTELSGNPGLPTETWGISGITVSRSNPDNLYAIVEAEAGGVFRSKDGGDTWQRTNQDRALRQRAWYYSRIYADPVDEESVYVLNVRFHRSRDGGKSFDTLSTPHGDNHDLWIAPDDPRRMIEGNDGGANVSMDGGATWTRQDNQPTAQIYRVSTDQATPYRILGAQQDNSALRIRSRSLTGGSIGVRDWEPTAGGESGHIVAKPDDPDVVLGGSYGGYLTWLDHRTGGRRAINVWPDNPMGWGADELRYRFQWNFPLFFSPHDPDVLYAAGNVLFRSDNLGASWTAISPDLSTDDKTKQGASGGPITKDNTGVEYYCTIFAAAESPRERGLLWCGTDDGRLHVSPDAGGTWTEVTPSALPPWTLINSIDVHPHRDGGLYVAATRYKSDDFQPYLYRTLDYGQTWTEISAGIKPDHFTRVLRADPEREGLLFAGTERGIYVSFDDGTSWQSMQGDLPIVPVTDLAIAAKGDLVAATQGRGFWVLDDLSVLRQIGPPLLDASAHLFAPRPTERRAARRTNEPKGAGENPPAGVALHYTLAAAPDADTPFELEILDAGGEVVRTFTAKPKPGAKKDEKRDENKPDTRLLPTDKGLNRFDWDLRHAPAARFSGMVLWNRRLAGPLALPGRYTARLRCGDWTGEVPFEIVPDPTSPVTGEDRAAQFAFLNEVRDKLSETHRALARVADVRREVEALKKRAAELDDGGETVTEAADALTEQMKAAEEALYQTKSKSAQDPLNFPIRLNDKLAGLLSLVGGSEHAPTQQALQVRDELVAAIDEQLALLRRIWTEDLVSLERAAREAGVPALQLEESREDDAKPGAQDR
ncbi:MAG: glycosyl hydrolase [Planctomycetota bacterium]